MRKTYPKASKSIQQLSAATPETKDTSSSLSERVRGTRENTESAFQLVSPAPHSRIMDSSPLIAQQRSVVDQINSHNIKQRPKYTGSNRVAPFQLARGSKGLDSIKNAIHAGTGAAEPIARDIYAIDSAHDGDFESDTVNKIKQSAQDLGYDATHATRLATKNPYKQSDLEANTVITSSGSGNFSAETFKPYTCPEATNHTLYFQNDFLVDGRAIFKRNYKNPAMAAFYANEVAKAQRDKIKTQLGGAEMAPITTIVRNNVVSTSGSNWMGTTFHNGPLSPEELRKFLTETVNGKSSRRIAADQGSQIMSGSVSGQAENWSVHLQLSPPSAVQPQETPQTPEQAEAIQFIGEWEQKIKEHTGSVDSSVHKIIAKMKELVPRLIDDPELLSTIKMNDKFLRLALS